MTFSGEALRCPAPFPSCLALALSKFAETRNDEEEIGRTFWTSRPLRRDRGTEVVKSPEILLQQHTRRPSKSGQSATSLSSEQSSAPDLPGYAADVWAVGCLLYELLTGSFLYGGEGVKALGTGSSPLSPRSDDGRSR